jgi:hypothetical protein
MFCKTIHIINIIYFLYFKKKSSKKIKQTTKETLHQNEKTNNCYLKENFQTKLNREVY